MICVSYKLSKKQLYEYYIQIVLKKWLIFGVAVGLFGIVFFSMLFPNTTLLIVTSICLITAVLMPPLTVWEVQRKGQALSGDKDAETTVVFDKSIKMTEGNVNVEIAYSQIADVIETKSLYLFMLGKSNAVIV